MSTLEGAARFEVLRIADGDSRAIGRLERLVELLRDENSRQNLVAAASLDEVWNRHILDSAQLLDHVPRGTEQPWLDLGTGAGFPGLVVAALRPQAEVVMVESRARRVAWLRHACEQLGLAQARVIGSPLESVEAFTAKVISARAFAPLQKLVALSARFSTANTIWLLPKGRSAWDEVATLTDWEHTFHVEHSATDPAAGLIIGSVIGPVGSHSGSGTRAHT